jgi:AraC family transcriptional activator of mtrCDE
MFDASGKLDQALQAALAELVAQEFGAGAMSTTLLKQVLIAIMRRSLNSADRWAERFSVLSDPKISRAFSEMVARPGIRHSLQSLAYASGLSRSAFVARFVEAFGDAPMTVLRRLRMRRARNLLATGHFTMDEVASAVGYSSRASFTRALRKAEAEE